ncbi:MAG: GTPase HflX, partial [Bdellovibrionales bacterium]|nr:GTPase HflX [Bdellovibrionales bacterium]
MNERLLVLMSNKLNNAVLVGIQLPKISTQELESSLQELTRLVTTLGYNVVGQVTQKRSSHRSASILGEGKMRELAEWTGGTGKIAAAFVHKLSKAKTKWTEEAEEEASEEVEEIEEPAGVLPEDKKNSAQIVIVDI